MNKLELLILGVILYLSYFLQTSVDFLALGDIKADFLLILIIYIALYQTPVYAMLCALLAGLIQDINIGGLNLISTDISRYYIGIHIIPKVLTAYLIATFIKHIHKDNILVLMVFVLGYSMLNGILTYININLFYNPTSSRALLSTVIPVAFYTACMSFIWFKILEWSLPSIKS